MASTMRRPRGTATNVKGLYVDVQAQTKDDFDRLVAATGTSAWAVVEAMISHTIAEVDAGRTPSWLPTAERSGQAAFFNRSEVSSRRSA